MTIANANAAFTAPAPVNNIASTSATAVTG